ncbi:hypothetical protein WICMUC_000637 [Wickerhamomyces mucosus]|uniref:Beta-lactamase-related domain-containing protein n=1 Tax=Wickerhamomyces mucosus TaxID=1378264 RepID=A0A9P8TIC0_9ASCO|nr:hypothetical protein WICMUC_000637 [Wickerhamomyces mucosus]
MTPNPKLSKIGIQQIKSIIDDAVKDTSYGIPGLSVSISNTNGDDLLSYANGKIGSQSNDLITTDNIFWIASCTKLLATVAILQLVEQNKLKLDDSNHLENLIPELKKLPIISQNKDDGSLKLIKRSNNNNKITLRHLLTHTAGFGYQFFDETTFEYYSQFGIDEFQLTNETQFLIPLLFEPGSRFNYGLNIDVAGLALERVTGEKLGDYIKKHIYDPLGLKDSTFFPDEELLQKLVHLHERNLETDELIEKPHILLATKGYNSSQAIHSGGAGSFSKPRNYVQFLAAIINDGVSPITGNRILQKETVDSMFINQIPQFPDFGRQVLFAKRGISRSINDLYPQEGNPPQGWGLSFFINLTDLPTGRSAGSGFWCGISNVYYWFDRNKGIVGMIASQILPFPDPIVLKTWVEVETAVYSNLV